MWKTALLPGLHLAVCLWVMLLGSVFLTCSGLASQNCLLCGTMYLLQTAELLFSFGSDPGASLETSSSLKRLDAFLGVRK